MDGLLEAKSELKWKFLLRTVHAAGVFKLCSFYGQSASWRSLCSLLPYTQPKCQNKMLAVNVSANNWSVHIDTAHTNKRIILVFVQHVHGSNVFPPFLCDDKLFMSLSRDNTWNNDIIFDRIQITLPASLASLLNVFLDDEH